MKEFRWVKKLSMGFAGLFFAMPQKGIAVEKKGQSCPANDLKKEQKAGSKFTKEELIDSLRKMERQPEKIEVISAMCYKMATLPEETEYQCNVCSHTTVYKSNSDQGKLTRVLPYMKRSLSLMPYKIDVDATGLCQRCATTKDKVVVMNTSCFNCGKKFSWRVASDKDRTDLQWLYLIPPINQIDGHDLGIPFGSRKNERKNKLENMPSKNLDDKRENKIREGVKYICEHIFCFECRKKIIEKLK